MKNTSKIRNPGNASGVTVDAGVAEKVEKATRLSERLGISGHEFITPPNPLSEKVKPVHSQNFDPIAAAERQLKQVSVGFRTWLNDDLKALREAFHAYSEDRTNEEKFQALNACIHTIKGNAPILGCEAAGLIADPLCALLEGCSEHKKTQPVLALSVSAICTALQTNPPADDPSIRETSAMLGRLTSVCRSEKEHSAQNDQAAGKASCSSSKCLTGRPCPNICSTFSSTAS